MAADPGGRVGGLDPTLPWRAAATLGSGAAGGLLGRLLAPRLSLVIGVLAAMATACGLRFKPSPDAVAWRPGIQGSGAPPASWLRWSDRGGRFCTTWPTATTSQGPPVDLAAAADQAAPLDALLSDEPAPTGLNRLEESEDLLLSHPRIPPPARWGTYQV
jgi:hypothetical protein